MGMVVFTLLFLDKAQVQPWCSAKMIDVYSVQVRISWLVGNAKSGLQQCLCAMHVLMFQSALKNVCLEYTNARC